VSFAKTIRNRRMQIGLQAAEVAKSVGLSIHEYTDIEQHTDEFETAISMGTARNVCHVLGLEFRSLLGLPNSAPNKTASVSDEIRRAREKQELSQIQLADRIGFSEETIRSSEDIPGFVDTLPLKVLFDLEKALHLEKGCLVRETTPPIKPRLNPSKSGK
jgi:transcriptional regulator with XRE-family HTH domain